MTPLEYLEGFVVIVVSHRDPSNPEIINEEQLYFNENILNYILDYNNSIGESFQLGFEILEPQPEPAA